MYKVPTFYCWSLEGIPRTHVLLPPLGIPWARARPWMAGWALLQDEKPQLWTISKTKTHTYRMYIYSTNMYKLEYTWI